LPLKSVNRLLALTSRLAPGPEALREAAGILARLPDAGLLLLRAGEEGVLPLLYRALLGIGEALPGPLAERLRAGYLANLARNARTYRSLEPFLEAVRRGGLRAALTKGSRLAPTVYGDIALRPFWDVDVVVHPQDWKALRAALERLGYEEASGDERLFNPGDPALHWAYAPYFEKDGTFLEFHFGFPGLHLPALPPEEIWPSVRRMPVGGSEALILSPEHELCHLCLHAQQHSYGKLIWLTDIAELCGLAGLDWGRVQAACHRAAMGAPVYHALRLVATLWPGTLPAGLVESFRPGPVTRAALRFLWPERAVAERTLPFEWPYSMPSVFSLWARRDVRLARRTLAAIMFPPRNWLAPSSGASRTRLGIYAHYAARLTRPAWMTVKRLVTKI